MVLRASTAGETATMEDSKFMVDSMGGAKNAAGSDPAMFVTEEAICWTDSVVLVEGSIWDTDSILVVEPTRLTGRKAEAEEAIARLTTRLENFILGVVVY